MTLYHFDIAGEHPFTDDMGLEKTDDSAAWREALRLTRDLEENLQANGTWALTVRSGARVVCSIIVTSSFQQNN